jgi:hypothetical protein
MEMEAIDNDDRPGGRGDGVGVNDYGWKARGGTRAWDLCLCGIPVLSDYEVTGVEGGEREEKGPRRTKTRC